MKWAPHQQTSKNVCLGKELITFIQGSIRRRQVRTLSIRISFTPHVLIEMKLSAVCFTK